MILIGFMFYFQNRNAKAEQEQLAAQAKKTEQTAKAKVSATNLNATAVTPTSVQKVNLQNDELALEFSSVGGQLSSVKLNKFEAFGGNHCIFSIIIIPVTDFSLRINLESFQYQRFGICTTGFRQFRDFEFKSWKCCCTIHLYT
jgi:hypothetical protein